MRDAVRILGIDPGTLVTGYGVVEQDGSALRHVASGVLAPPPGDVAQRLRVLFEALERVIAEHAPASVAVEDLFHARNAKSALTLGHARGVALLAAARAGLTVHAYAPPLVKKAVVGHGRAEKHQVQQMIRALLGLEFVPAEDAADALAVAICHCQRLRSPLAALVAGMRER
jgi:crossover junction endodeoxyribonuclease RuvC